MVTRARPATAAVLGGLVALAGTGCSQTGGASVPLDRATGAVLADAADRLADALAADDHCRALLEADALRERAWRALADGDAPETVVAETTRVVDATTADLACDGEEGDAEDDGDGGDGDEETEDDATDEDARRDAPSSDGSGGDPTSPRPTTDDGGDGSADESGGDRGPDGEGPPGHDKDPGGAGGGPPDDRGGPNRGGGG